MILNFTTEVRKGKLKGFVTNFVEKIKSGSKIHTIREDKKERWKAGNKIHFATGPYKKGRVFHEGECTKTEKIAVRWVKVDHIYSNKLKEFQIKPNTPAHERDILYIVTLVAKDGTETTIAGTVAIEGYYLRLCEIEELAINDGLESIDNFFAWFDKDFDGKIIHWVKWV